MYFGKLYKLFLYFALAGFYFFDDQVGFMTQMAFFKLFPAPARARIISADLLHCYLVTIFSFFARITSSFTSSAGSPKRENLSHWQANFNNSTSSDLILVIISSSISKRFKSYWR